MKLRNKKTGEIDDYIFEVITDRIDLYRRTGHSDTKNVWHYKSLAELNAEWEDYEEPKDFWFIDPEILIACESTEPLLCDKKVAIETMKQIGNYFDTREEAEKAVEKLKAWKRLKDKGFKFFGYDDGYKHDFNSGHIEFYVENDGGVLKDLDLLFGDEE